MQKRQMSTHHSCRYFLSPSHQNIEPIWRVCFTPLIFCQHNSADTPFTWLLLPLPFATAGGAEGSKQETQPPRSKSLVLQRLLHNNIQHMLKPGSCTHFTSPPHCLCDSSDDPSWAGRVRLVNLINFCSQMWLKCCTHSEEMGWNHLSSLNEAI